MARRATRQTRDRATEWLIAAAGGFLLGALVMAVLTVGPARGFFAPADPRAVASGAAIDGQEPSPTDVPTLTTPPAASDAGRSRPAVTSPSPDLAGRRLLVPVDGVTPEDLVASFDDRRGTNRRHEAIDILAPLRTPVLAVEDGTVAKLFTSDAGGLTIYQFDPSGRYVYYYAHLDGYARGLREGAAVRAGQVIGFVGTTGNAPEDVPHLHFAILEVSGEGRWWDGVAVDPYPLLGGLERPGTRGS